MLSQLQFPGMEGPERPAVPTDSASAPTPLQQRLAKMYAQRQSGGYLAGHRLRLEDSDAEEAKNYDDTGAHYDDEERGPTRLGEPGEIATGDHIRNEAWGISIPREVNFGSPQSAWRKHGHYEEVPVPEISTVQREVSSRRVKQIMDDPSMADNPRLPYPERAHGYRYDDDTVVVTDGNHRTMSHVLGGQMFVPMQVAGREDVPRFKEQANRIDRLHQWTQDNPNANPNWRDEYEERTNDHLYGTGNW